ncbi:MAG: carbon storage regulator CsrA [Solirubrobacteraceae bacterium]|nr:carbon storage regulator CsrA [Solirubrobacteraceae bacterium]
MLVLTRKTNQTIMIGDEIEVTILSISGEKVRLGIKAPREVPVFREEVTGSAPGSPEPVASEESE